MSVLSRIAKSASPGTGYSLDMEKPKPMMEYGATGLLRTKGQSGIIYEEWLRQLQGPKEMQLYREMRDNDSTIGAAFFAIEMLLRRTEWTVIPAKGSKGKEIAQFVQSCIDDCEHTLIDFMCEAFSMITFGHSVFEVVYKRRQGPDKKTPSRHKDGLIGWKKFAPRAQESILYWPTDPDTNDLTGIVQQAAPDWRTVAIPIEKLLIFRTTSLKDNPRGRSFLRNSVRPYLQKRRLEEVEGTGIERELVGYPICYADADVVANMPGGEAALKRMITNMRRDDQEGLLLPNARDDKGNRKVEVELLKTGGAKNTDVAGAIKAKSEAILNTMLAGFIALGQTEHGARSLHISQTQLFVEAISALEESIAGEFNRVEVTRLLALNNIDPELAPELKPGEIGVRDLEETANFVLKLSQAGIFLADPATEDWLRKLAKMPQRSMDYVPGAELDETGSGDDTPQPVDDQQRPRQRGPKLRKPAAQTDSSDGSEALQEAV